jgi:hypothetical protein
MYARVPDLAIAVIPVILQQACKQAVKMTRLSCHRFRSDEVRLGLSLIAYNLGISGGGWRCRRRSAESHLTRRLFGSMVRPNRADQDVRAGEVFCGLR